MARGYRDTRRCNMKMYLAAAFPRHAEVNGYRRDLEAMGHFVTSRWHDSIYRHGSLADEDATDDVIRSWAVDDMSDLLAADAVISFTGAQELSRGGRHVEFGIALATGKTLVIIGNRENVFHWWHTARILPDVTAFLEWAKDRAGA